MTPEQLNAIKERVANATPGPWEVCNGTDVFTPLGSENKAGIQANHNDGWYIAKTNEGTTSVGDEEISLSFSEQNANARFISSCRQDIPALVAEVERLRAELTDIIAVATEEASCITHDNGYEDIIAIARSTLK